MYETLALLVATAVCFAIGKIRSDVVALCALVLLVVMGILTPEEALAGFSSTVVVMMVGLFVVGGAVLRTGLAKKISGKIMKMARGSKLALFVLVMLVTAAIGAFVSNTGTVALMLPIVVSLAARADISASRLLMPLAFASSMGGMLTLIGTPPNLVIQDALIQGGYQPLSFFSFSPVGLVCIGVGIVVLLPLSKWFLSKTKNNDDYVAKGKTLSQLVDEYQLNNRLSRLKVTPGSKIKGKTLGDLNLRSRYNLTVMEVRKVKGLHKMPIKNVSQHMAGPNTVFQEEDIIYITGAEEQADLFANEYGLQRLNQTEDKNGGLNFYDIGIAEIVIMPASKLVGRNIRQSGFRENYHINILGIRRKGEYITTDLVEQRLLQGDVLLVQGTWKDIARLSTDEDDLVVLGEPLEQAAKVTLDYKAPLAAAIMVAMVVMMVFDFIPIAPVTAVLIAALLMVLGGCFKSVDAAYNTINWESVVLIAAMMPMSVALEKTGASAMISHSLVAGLGTMGPLALLAGIYFTTSLLTMFISNTATAVLMAPIAMASATETGASPYAFLFAVSVAASMCFASPFSTPPNALVMQAGRYSFMDYIRVGLPLQIIIGIVMIFVLPLLFPL